MAARAKSRKKSSPPSSGRLPVVLGLGTIVVLFAVGWMLMHGGPNEAMSSVKNAFRGFLSGEAGEKTSREDLQATIDRLERRIREMEETHRKEIRSLRERYEQQLEELKLENKLLQDENKRLQRSS